VAADDMPSSPDAILNALCEAFERAGAHAVVVVSLASESAPALEVVRVVAPPLRDVARTWR
jgi:ribosomal protein S12 methylthiotransferase accessory factor